MKKFWLGVVVAAAIIAALVIFARSASPVRVRSDEISGEWRGARGAQIIFGADGKFTANEFPMQTSSPGAQPVVVRSGSGSWKLSPLREGSDQELHIYFDPTEPGRGVVGKLLRVSFEGVKGGIYIDDWDDVSNRFVFKKT